MREPSRIYQWFRLLHTLGRHTLAARLLHVKYSPEDPAAFSGAATPAVPGGAGAGGGVAAAALSPQGPTTGARNRLSVAQGSLQSHALAEAACPPTADTSSQPRPLSPSLKSCGRREYIEAEMMGGNKATSVNTPDNRK